MPTLPPVLQFVHRPGVLDLGWGHPRPDLLPVRGWAAAAAASAREVGWQALAYGHATGPGPLLGWLAGHLGDATPEQTFVTGGASHGLALIAGLLAEPGDVALVDAPAYHLAFPILRDAGLRLVAAADDLPAQLRTLRAAGERVPLLYLVPTFANPTGRSLPGDRRQALADLARTEELTVLEDDTYRELAYDGPAPPALWRLAGGDRVVRLGSFAKTVAPGRR